MASAYLLDPDAARAWLRRRFANRRRQWLLGEDDWPLRVPLGPPREADALADFARVQQWQAAWQRWQGPGEVDWIARRWVNVGTQQLPRALVLDSAEQVADALGEGASEGWRRAVQRHAQLVRRSPALHVEAARHFEVLVEWADADWQRLVDLLDWIDTHPDSGLYIRQLPIPGLDSKWLERHRGVVRSLLAARRTAATRESPAESSADPERMPTPAEGTSADLHRLAGLRPLPVALRMRLLDDDLRACCGGLGDIAAPIEELAALQLPVRRVFIVENLQTGLAFGDLPGSALFMGQGYAVDIFDRITWLRGLPCHYWGDLDTHGFAILDRLRTTLPNVRSVLMDEETLLEHRALWSEEPKQAAPERLERLTQEEQALHAQLRTDHFGRRVRLEQERIDWGFAWRRLQALGNAD